MSQELTAVSSNSISDPAEGKGMSDEEELRRFAQVYNETVETGETLVDISAELKELGIEKV